MSTASKNFRVHTVAIRMGAVTKTNIIGLRKAFNALERTRNGWTVGSTAPRITEADEAEYEYILEAHPPARVVGELHDSGIKQLKSKRYRKQLESVADIIDDLQYFTFRGFDIVNDHYVPVFRAHDSKGRSFPYRNVPWQSGGNGPELVSANYF